MNKRGSSLVNVRLSLILILVSVLLGCSSFPSGIKKEKINFSQEVPALQADLFVPKSKEKVPVVIVVHGGGWTNRTGEMTTICKKLTRQGIAAFNITYRFAPKHLYPKAVVDVQAALTWLKENGAKYNIDTSRVGGWGYSAGAHLILLAGLHPDAGLSAIVAGGTPAKLNEWPDSPIVKTFLGQPMETHEELWKKASPYYNVSERSPAVFMYHGSKDELVQPNQMQFMSEALKAKKVPVTTHMVKGLGHAFVYLFSYESENKGVEFLKTALAESE